MKHPWKRSLACLVALLLMLQLLPTGALAAGRDPGPCGSGGSGGCQHPAADQPLTDGEPEAQ